MKRKINQTASFALLRKLPPQVSFLQVEQWVKNHSFTATKKNTWLSAWLSRWRSLN